MDRPPSPSESYESDSFEEKTDEPEMTTKPHALVVHTVPVSIRPSNAATSRVPLREPRTVPYEIYVEMVQECDFLHGQNSKLHRLVDSMVVGPARGAPNLFTDVSIRVRALVEITT